MHFHKVSWGFFLGVLSEMWVFGCDDFLSVFHHEAQLTQNVITTIVLMSVTQGAITLSLHKFQQVEVSASHCQIINVP